MLRSFVIGAFSALTLSVAANAADIYRAEGPGGYKDDVYVPVASWTGFYVGVNGGYGWQRGDNATVQAIRQSDGVVTGVYKNKLDLSGGFGGGQAGYNLQRGSYVFGIEADIEGSGISGDGGLVSGYFQNVDPRLIRPDFKATTATALDVNWFGTVRGRIGYSFGATLVYATGGFAYGDVDLKSSYSDNNGYSASLGKSELLTGFAVGGGVEHKINPAWSVKVEYQYLDLGSTSKSASFSVAPGTPYTLQTDADVNFHTVRVGLNYHVPAGYEPLK